MNTLKVGFFSYFTTLADNDDDGVLFFNMNMKSQTII